MGSLGSAFGGHPVCCAASLAAITEMMDRDLAGNAKKMSDYFCSLPFLCNSLK